MAVQTREIAVAQYKLAISADSDGCHIRLQDRGGAEQLCIEIGPEGPVLKLSAGLTIDVVGALRLGAQVIDIEGRDSVRILSRGNLTIDAGQDLGLRARQLSSRARLGNHDISANGDVVVDGERIFLNP